MHTTRLAFLTSALGAVSAAMYTNPVLAMDFPDPVIVRSPDGAFYAYSTMGNGHHIQVANSSDLVNWNYLGEALSLPLPAWYVGPNTWAPDVTLVNATYYMYFGASGAVGMCIAVATSTSPAGPFLVLSTPLMCATEFGDIDPKMIADVDGTPYIFWGSDFQPIRVQQLAANLTALAPGSQPTVILTPNASAPYESLVEGSWLQRAPAALQPAQDGFFLYFSGDACCGAGAHYAVMVAFAPSLRGPYARRSADARPANASSVVVSANAAFTAPGHNCVVVDDAGDEWLFYHAYVGGNTGGPRTLMADKVQRYAGVGGALLWPVLDAPSSAPQPAPVVRAQAAQPAPTT